MWKDINGYEGHYKVNINGDVMSFKRFNKTGNKSDVFILKPKIDAYGYHEVSLFIGGKVKCMKIHRLVAIAFIENPQNKPQVNHIDANKINNNLSNLEWATPQEDANHRRINNLIPKGKNHYSYGKCGGESKTAKIVLNIENGVFYDCVKDAAKAYDIKYKTLVGMLNGRDNNWTNLIYA